MKAPAFAVQLLGSCSVSNIYSVVTHPTMEVLQNLFSEVVPQFWELETSPKN